MPRNITLGQFGLAPQVPGIAASNGSMRSGVFQVKVEGCPFDSFQRWILEGPAVSADNINNHGGKSQRKGPPSGR